MRVYVVLESLWGDPEKVIGVCSSRASANDVVREAYSAFMRDWSTTSYEPEYRIEAMDLNVYRFAG